MALIVAFVTFGIASEPIPEIPGRVAAFICLAGVARLTAPNHLRNVLGSARDPAALMGVIAAACFALAAVGIRGASTSLEGPTWNRALLTLTVMLGIQTLVNASHAAKVRTLGQVEIVIEYLASALVLVGVVGVVVFG